MIERRYFNPVVETMSRPDLERLQWKRIKYQLDYLYNRNAFYRTLLDQHKVKPEDINTWDDFRKRIPLIKKKNVMADQTENAPWGDRLGIDRRQMVRFYMTSGTSGLGQELYGVTESDVVFNGTTWCFSYAWSGLQRGDLAVNCLPGSAAPLAGCDSPTEAFKRFGLNGFHLYLYKSPQKIEMMVKYKPEFIWATGTYVVRLMELCKQMGIDPKKEMPNLKSMLIGGPWTYEAALELEAFWGCEVHEMYGQSALGTSIAFTCEDGCIVGEDRHPGVMHFLEHMGVMEVLDPETREPVKSGEYGELVLTTFKEASPILRYGTDDRVMFVSHEDCGCGRPFHGLGCFQVSRYDDMMKIKGTNVWPQAVDSLVLSKDGIEEYQAQVYITEGGREELDMQLEFTAGLGEDRKRALLQLVVAEMKKKIGVSPNVSEAPESLPRFEFKVARWNDTRREGRKRVMYTES